MTYSAICDTWMTSFMYEISCNNFTSKKLNISNGLCVHTDCVDIIIDSLLSYFTSHMKNLLMNLKPCTTQTTPMKLFMKYFKSMRDRERVSTHFDTHFITSKWALVCIYRDHRLFIATKFQPPSPHTFTVLFQQEVNNTIWVSNLVSWNCYRNLLCM